MSSSSVLFCVESAPCHPCHLHRPGSDEPSTMAIATVKTPSSRDRTRTSPATRGGGAVVDTSLFPSRRGEPEHT